ncbi:hypothetical protein MMC22_004390 [Lobaria immixta]|nr:hypothetical protein [Lobaria immixta]
MTESNDRPFVNSTTPDNEPNVGGAMSRNGDVANVISTRTGLLDLPPEIRLMIFRHLLVHPTTLPDLSSNDQPFSDDFLLPDEFYPDHSILRTSKLIHREAFDVYYRENRFNCHFWKPSFPIFQVPRIVNTIQNIETRMPLSAPCSNSNDIAAFLKLRQFFGNYSVFDSIIRGNLVLELYIDPTPYYLEWLVRALGRFTSFTMINLHLNFLGPEAPENDFLEWCEHLKTALEPVLGYAEELEAPE